MSFNGEKNTYKTKEGKTHSLEKQSSLKSLQHFQYVVIFWKSWSSCRQPFSVGLTDWHGLFFCSPHFLQGAFQHMLCLPKSTQSNKDRMLNFYLCAKMVLLSYESFKLLKGVHFVNFFPHEESKPISFGSNQHGVVLFFFMVYSHFSTLCQKRFPMLCFRIKLVLSFVKLSGL
jgi:hypothetical protein